MYFRCERASFSTNEFTLTRTKSKALLKKLNKFGTSDKMNVSFLCNKQQWQLFKAYFTANLLSESAA